MAQGKNGKKQHDNVNERREMNADLMFTDT